ncbi:hypothetical protein BASA50_008418 [Batrachochytrium salamandrivorans]|uniref:Zinc finger CCHC domain-containing protein 10 n=1 Tax=Batrachochytrium salamandrivorans TaxID=1357716 RepID=A0ABQ8F4C2_9FUNG|nr:hypothetical protein BASA50_008418 [Batrachochytrium salamandrivorans]
MFAQETRVESLSQIRTARPGLGTQAAISHATKNERSQCQKCLSVGHWTYQCAIKDKPYVSRPSRTKQMQKRQHAAAAAAAASSLGVAPMKDAGTAAKLLSVRKGLADRILKEKADRRKLGHQSSSSSSSSSESDSSSNSGSSSSGSSSSSSSSGSSSSGSSNSSSGSSSSNSSSSSSSDSDSNSSSSRSSSSSSNSSRKHKRRRSSRR